MKRFTFTLSNAAAKNLERLASCTDKTPAELVGAVAAVAASHIKRFGGIVMTIRMDKVFPDVDERLKFEARAKEQGMTPEKLMSALIDQVIQRIARERGKRRNQRRAAA